MILYQWYYIFQCLPKFFTELGTNLNFCIWQKAKETKKCHHRDVVDDDDLVEFCQLWRMRSWGHFYVMGCQLIRRRRQLGPIGSHLYCNFKRHFFVSLAFTFGQIFCFVEPHCTWPGPGTYASRSSLAIALCISMHQYFPCKNIFFDG
jgi:hypothetical protein